MTIMLNILFAVYLITLIIVCLWIICGLAVTGIDLLRDFRKGWKK